MPANLCFLSLNGAQALSEFRQQRLLSALQEQGIELSHIQAQFVHLAWSQNALTAQQAEVLKGLLNYGEPFQKITSKGFFEGAEGLRPEQRHT